MAPMFILASQISPLKTTSAIKVRLVRTYEVAERRGSDSIKSKECIFHDEQGTYLHAHIPKEHVGKYLKVFKEGKVYGIKNFLVITNFFSYKTSNHRFMLKFNYSTLVKEYKNDGFPRHMYRLKAFPDLKNHSDDKDLVDVIGRLVEIYSPLDKVIAGKNSRLIDFLIEDTGGNQLKCTVWDQHVSTVESFFNKVQSDPIVILMQFVRVKNDVNTGEVKICSSYDATQLLFKKDLPEIEEFCQRLSTQHTPLRSITSFSSMTYSQTEQDMTSGRMVITTIADLYERKECGDYWIPAKIANIEGYPDWSYLSCKSKGCNKKLVPKSGLYSCEKCSRIWAEGIWRYRLKVRVVDVNGNAPFLLWDRECSDLIGMTAAELKALYPMENGKIPKELKALVGLSIVFKIAARKEQFDNLFNAFPVLKIQKDSPLLEIHCPELPDSQSKDLSSKILLAEDDTDTDEGFFMEDEDEAESPVTNINSVKEVSANGSVAVKRCLLDELSSTHSSKKNKPITVKLEKINCDI